MDDNNMSVDTGAEEVNTGAATEDKDTSDIVSMSKEEYDRALQSEADKVRSKLSKEIRELKAQLPVQKSKAELDLESRLADIETKQLEVEAREKDLALRAALQEANLDKSIADFIRTDIDATALCSAIEKIVNAKIAAQGYVPSNNHANNTGITLEQINKMDYTEVEKIYKANPDLVKKLIGK